MAVDIRGLPIRAAAPAPHVRLRSRVYGLGSVFGKTLRDSRFAILVVGGLLCLMTVAGGGGMGSSYGTPETRLELAAMSRDMPPVLRGFYGNPVDVDTLGGFLSWHYGAYFAMLAGLWSILALSSTLAGEARRGSLDLAVATQRSKRSIGFEKVAGHVTALAIATSLVAIAAWVTGVVFGTMPNDAISPAAAAAFGIGIALRALIAGSIAFALASLLGRGAAAGIAGAVMLGGYVVYGYRTVVPAFDSVAGATWYSWGADFIPLAGRYDWSGVALMALLSALLLAIGLEVFARRDVGSTVAIPGPALPRSLLGIRGPVGRSFGDSLPAAFWWAIGLGIYGVVMAAASGSLIDMLASSPGLSEVFRTLVPGLDLTSAAGFLQLAFADIGFVLFGLAAATFIAGRWSDESAGRLELQLATPLTRVRWAVASGVAVGLAVGAITVFLGVAIGLGVATVGQDPATPATGTIVLGVYGLALAGIGMAAGGLLGPAFAAPVVVTVAIGMLLLDTFAPILRLPDWVAELALTSHLGEPMVGRWDETGVIACVALAVGGLALGAWGMQRRDVGR